MNRIFQYLLFFLSFCIALSAPAQSLFFSNLSTRHGLPSNIISAVAQDSRDFIWIGTGNGLARYDGYTFKAFKRLDHASSLPANEISALLPDGDFVWVGTWRGLCKINTLDFSITRIDLKGNDVVRTLYKDKKGNIWIGTASGLISIRHDLGMIHYTAENNQLSHNTVRSIFVDDEENLWVGTYDKLNLLQKNTDQFISFDLKENYKPELKNNLIQDIKPVADKDSVLWIGTETGLCLFNKYTHNYISYRASTSGLSNEVIKNIFSDAIGNVWLGTDFGLNVFNPQTKTIAKYFNNPNLRYSIANNVVWQIMEDSGGVMWFVTNNGLSKINLYNTAFVYHEVTQALGDQTSGNQVKALLVTTGDILWIATLHGVIRFNPTTQQRMLFDTDSPPTTRLLLDNVFALEEDELGRIWIGTAGGINIWDEKTKRMHAITANKENGLTSNYIARFTKGADGSFWVSAWEGGLYKVASGFNDLNNIHFEFVGDFASEKITYAVQALWALQNNELYRIDLTNYLSKRISSFNTLAKGRDIYNLYYVPQGSIWAGTLNGLIEYKPQQDSAVFHPIITGNDINFTNIMSDLSGNLWAAANQFLLKFTPADRSIQLFPLDKELPLTTFYNSCTARTGAGALLFGGDNGYISFSPNIKPNIYQPHVFITSLEVNNKTVTPMHEINHTTKLVHDIAFTSEITLDYAQRSFTASFASLHYWQPDINVYAYKLEGLDQEWKYVSGQKNFAVYANLLPGTYTLQVKATNNYGVWSPHTASLKIHIKPPLFLSLGFIVLYIILAIAALIAGFRIYAIRLKLKNKLNIALLEKEHAEEIVQTKQQFFTSISHELRTPISLIIPPIQQVLKRDQLQEEDRTLISLAEKNSQRLLRLINQILDFRKLEHESQSLKISWFDLVPFCQELSSLFADKAARNEINFTFHPLVNSCSVWADKEKVEIIIFNLLSNAFKFTPKKGKITFSIEIDNAIHFTHGAAKLTVKDTGIGITKEEHEKVFEQFYQTTDGKKSEDGSGIGLTLVTEYTKLHHGEVKLESVRGTGSIFSIYLPLGSDHFPLGEMHQSHEVDIVLTKGIDNTFNLKSDKPLILLVEDNHDMIDFITIALKDKYNFLIAENGEEALQKISHIVPEIIISDIMMPVMDGLELCRQIKQDNRTSPIPIILLTAKSLTTHKIEGIRIGADAYITKPFEIELLEAHIDHLLQRKTELTQYFRNELITQPINDVTGKGNEDDTFLKKVMNSIESNLSNPDFSVEVLSAEMGMSSTHLYRKLKSLTQLSANEIIKRYRIKKASFLLKNKEGNISEIMYEVGFVNLSYFSKCFRSEFGVTPKEYQQRESKHSFNVEQKLKED